jgi:hypothetical protein
VPRLSGLNDTICPEQNGFYIGSIGNHCNRDFDSSRDIRRALRCLAPRSDQFIHFRFGATIPDHPKPGL